MKYNPVMRLMQSITKKILAQIGVSCAVTGLTLGPVCAASTSVKEPTVSATLESSTEIISGQPICVRCSIEDADARPICVNLGFDWKGFYTFSVEEASSKRNILPDIPLPTGRSQKVGGETLNPILDIAPSRHLTQYIVVSKCFKTLKPGQYIIHFHVHLPYTASQDTMMPGEPIQGTDLGKAEKMDAESDTDFDCRLHVLRADSQALKATAMQLAREITRQQTDPWDLQSMTTELFAMPAGEASAAWKWLAEQGNVWNSTVAWSLRDCPSKEGVDIAAQIMDDRKADIESRQAAQQSLYVIYVSASASVKDYIRDIASAHDLPPPGNNLPSVSD